MKRINWLLAGLVSGLIFFANIAAAASSSPEGLWKTVDDKTGRTKSIIKIYSSGQTLEGKVIKIFPKDGSNDQNKLCKACKGEKKDQKIVGMVILSGLKNVGENEWKEGEILDPDNGKTYSCNMKLIDDGKKLEVHGFIGLSIIGRTQTWLRADDK